MNESEKTTCANCGREIGSAEKAYVVGDKIICVKCDENPLWRTTDVSPQVGNDKTESPKPKQETLWLPFSQANKIGMIVAAACILWAFASFVFEYMPQPRTKTVKLYLPRETHGIGGTFSLSPYEQESVVPAERKHWAGIIVPFFAGLALLNRSFRPKLGVWQGFLTLMGGLIITAACIAMFLPVLPDRFVNFIGNWSIEIFRVISFGVVGTFIVLGLRNNVPLILGAVVGNGALIVIGWISLSEGLKPKKISAKDEIIENLPA